MARDKLFQDSDLTSRRASLLFGDNRTPPHISDSQVGDHVHGLSDKSLQKLISLKFQNDPLRLVRQLSKDLADKEAELILLRKQTFAREHELVRLCMEYGNLSSSEVDQKLKAIESDSDVHTALSEMISSAVTTSAKAKTTTTEPRSKRVSPHKEQKRTSEDVPEPSQYQEPHKSFSRMENHRSDESLPLAANLPLASNLNKLKSYIPFRAEDPAKPPVELEAISSKDPNDLYSTPDPNTDKYGFYNRKFSPNGSQPTLANADINDPGLLSLQKTSVASTNSGSMSVASPMSASTHDFSIDEARMNRSMDELKRLGDIYDTVSEERLQKWDRFISQMKRRDTRRASEEHSSEVFGLKGLNLRKRDHRFTDFFKSGDESPDDFEDYKTFRNLIYEDGIPAKHRTMLWLELSGAKNRAVFGEYQRLLSLATSSKDPAIRRSLDQINLDLHRTLPSNRYFHDASTSQPGPHLERLKNILYAFVAYRTDTGYSQGMNKIVGNLLLGINEANSAGGQKASEEDAFWLFVSLVEDILPRYGELNFFQPESVAQIQKDVCSVEKHHFPKLLPDLWAHFQQLGQVEVSVILLGWWLGVFTEAVVSVEFWFKILDGLLVSESAEAKFASYSLGIFKVFEKSFMNCESANDVYRFVNRLRSGTVAGVRFGDLMAICTTFEKLLFHKEEKRRIMR